MFNRGKEFEKRFFEAMLTINDAVVYRVPDQLSGFYGSKNFCDFMIYSYPSMFFFECKSVKGNLFPFSNIEDYQLKGLLEKSKINGAKAGIVIWFIEYQKVYFIDIKFIKYLIDNSVKSINVNYCEEMKTKGIIQAETQTRAIYPKFTCPYKFLGDIRWQN